MIEFELQISEDNAEYYLTVNNNGEFLDKTFNNASEVREWLKNEFNLTQEQIHKIVNKNSFSDCSQVLNEGNENCLDIDEQMHEMQEREAEYAEIYAEMYETLI